MKTIKLIIVLTLTVSLLLFTALLPAITIESETTIATEQNTPSLTYIDANKNALASMLKLPMDEPLYMLNMIRIKDKAEYNEDCEFSIRGWTGAQA